jgi:uncharacterized heparinase superfamily protein
MAFADQPRIIGLALSGGLRRVRRSVLSRFSRRIGGVTPERLVIAPPDLHTADPIVAQDIYSGIFFFGGHTESVDGDSPFRVNTIHERWERELNSFRC